MEVVYRQLDYHRSEQNDHSSRGWWGSHWQGRSGLKRDITEEGTWPVIRDVLEGRSGCLLEAGCGVPNWVHAFQCRGFRAVGIDYADSGLRIGKQVAADLLLVQGDLRALPFPNDTFDYVVSFGAIEHDPAGPEAALRELRRVLAPSGRLLCSVPCLNLKRHALLPWFVLRDWLKRRALLRRLAGKTDPLLFYQHVWSPGTYRAILEGCGFVVSDLRLFGSVRHGEWLKGFASVLDRRIPLLSAHMMMAICRKA